MPINFHRRAGLPGGLSRRNLLRLLGLATIVLITLTMLGRAVQSSGTADLERRAEVVRMFQHAWSGYKQYAWGKDELRPLSRTSTVRFGLGATLVDSLDVLHLMGLHEELQEARAWVAASLDCGIAKDQSLFETTIRVLGGLLSAHQLTSDALYLQKAAEVHGLRRVLVWQYVRTSPTHCS